MIYCSNSTIKYRVYENLIILLGVANNRTIHAPTSRHCFVSVSKNSFKNFDYRYLLIIYTSQQQFYLHCSYRNFLSELIKSFKTKLMCFTFKKNNKWTEKLVNPFLQDGASAGIRSLQTSIAIKLCQTP